MSCRFPAGVVSGIAGASGTGKTLLLSSLLGLAPVAAGTVRVGDLDPVTDPLGVRRHVCFVPARAPLLPHLSALEHVRHLVKLCGGRQASEPDVVNALRASELPDRLMRERCAVLTGYGRLSVWLAVHRLRMTNVLLLDDPAHVMTARQATECARLIHESVADTGSVVVTSRDARFVADAADRVFWIEHGQLVQQATLRPSWSVENLKAAAVIDR